MGRQDWDFKNFKSCGVWEFKSLASLAGILVWGGFFARLRGDAIFFFRDSFAGLDGVGR